jgi:copper chaperone CopZ
MSSSPADPQQPASASSRPDDDLVYRVEGMTCAHCTAAVSEEVAKVAGVSAVEIDLDTKLVHVRGTGLDAAAIIAAIDEAGYDAA